MSFARTELLGRPHSAADQLNGASLPRRVDFCCATPRPASNGTLISRPLDEASQKETRVFVQHKRKLRAYNGTILAKKEMNASERRDMTTRRQKTVKKIFRRAEVGDSSRRRGVTFCQGQIACYKGDTGGNESQKGRAISIIIARNVPPSDRRRRRVFDPEGKHVDEALRQRGLDPEGRAADEALRWCCFPEAGALRPTGR
jgi:hypothetical protein